MKNTLNFCAAVFCGFFAADPGTAQQHIHDFTINVPIKIVGDSTKIKTGIWVDCRIVRNANGSYRQIHQNYVLASPGDLVVPPPDGTFNIAFEWTIPPDMKNRAKWGDAPYYWSCRMLMGHPQQNLSQVSSFVEKGDPVAPATFGTCDFIQGELNADFTASGQEEQHCAGSQ